MMLRSGGSRCSRLWRDPGLVCIPARDYGTKKETFYRRQMEEFFEYQESLRNPDLITVLQRTKNVLSSHWRCQLVTSSTAAKRDDKLHASIVQYAFFQKPYVCLSTEDKLHKTDLVMDSNATIFVGHTDPPPLMETIKLLGKVPPHVILTGVMAYAEDSEVTRVKNELLRINAAAKEVVEIGGQALGPIFETAKELLDAQFEARANLLNPETDTSIYMFRPRSCQYVDFLGEKRDVDILDGLSPSIDAFSTLLPALVEGINQSHARRFALKVFCMVYRHVRAEEALLYSIDRRGFDVFAKVIKGASAEWKGYRFNFFRPVNDALGVCRQLVEMERNCWEILRKSPVLASVVSREAAAFTTTTTTTSTSSSRSTEIDSDSAQAGPGSQDAEAKAAEEHSDSEQTSDIKAGEHSEAEGARADGHSDAEAKAAEDQSNNETESEPEAENELEDAKQST